MTTGDGPDREGTIITFYSYKGGAGRTMALANVAWLLASNGHRVLTLDWDLESPGLHRYFHPFLVDKDLRESDGVIDLIRDFAKAATRPAAHDPSGANDLLTVEEMTQLAHVRRYASSLDYPFPGEGCVDLVPAGKQSPDYSARVSTFNWDDFYERLGGGAFLTVLRRELRRHYDYILIDSRTGLSDNAGICTVVLPDVLVNCFTMSTQSIDGAVAVARSIRNLRRDPIRIFPVPTRVEDGEQTKLERSRSYARQRFEPFIRALERQDSDNYWGSVEVPYKAFYAYEEILAAFGDRPRQAGTLLSAYERLARIITGAPCELPSGTPAQDQNRQRWLAEFERRTPLNPVNLVISYAPRQRIWAEWIAAELDRVSQPSELRELRLSADAVDRADRMVVLLSKEYVRSRDAQKVFWRGEDRHYDGPGSFLIPVRLDTIDPPEPFTERGTVDLNGLSAPRAREVLLAALGLPDVPPGPGAGEGQSWPRFPATLPPIWNVPVRNPAFTGRDALLEQLRERLFAHATAKPVALIGLGGVGKTQIALEYAHRFAAHYDLVWWISTDQAAIARAELGRLAVPLGLTLSPNATTTEQVESVLQALRQGTRSPRWLIIFDNPDDADAVRHFLPDGPGDIIITTRNTDWTRFAERLEIGVFERHESIELISSRIDTLPPADANAVAERLGDLPLAVEQAAAWLEATGMSVRNYLEFLDTRLSEVLAESSPAGYPATAAATWSLSMQRLRERKPAAARLMELFSFLSPEPIPTWLLQTPRMIEELAKIDSTQRDPLFHGSLIREIRRLALAQVDPAINAIRVHRLVQSVIRESLAGDHGMETRVQVQEILAAAAAARQGGADDQGNWSTYDELRPHLVPSGALDSRDSAVRQLVVVMVRYLRLRGDLAGSEELARQALDHWAAFGAPDTVTLRLRVQLANTLRTAGRDDDSRRISEEVTAQLTELAGEDHPYTLESAGGLAADLWSAGRYAEALKLNRDILQRWRSGFGDDHDRTLMAANNLAHAERLNGNLAEAVRLDADTLDRRKRTLGPENTWTLWSATNYGLGVRELGQYREARDLLERTVEQYRRLLGLDHSDTLRAARILAGSLRRMGSISAGATIAEDTRTRYERTLGTKHRETMLAALEVACAQSAQGEHSRAQTTATEVLDYYSHQYGAENPYTLAAGNDVAVFRLRAGDIRAARSLLEEIADTYAATLGKEHPSTLVCRLNLANARHADGDHASARRLDERTYTKLLEQFGPEHPAVIMAMANFAASLRDTGSAHDGHNQLQEAIRLSQQVLGQDHPNTRAIRDGLRVNTDIEPFTP